MTRTLQEYIRTAEQQFGTAELEPDRESERQTAVELIRMVVTMATGLLSHSSSAQAAALNEAKEIANERESLGDVDGLASERSAADDQAAIALRLITVENELAALTEVVASFFEDSNSGGPSGA